ncbi:helix-turn-helix transcriptional regulator [Methylosinus sp. LW4]|uniref:helix-turn-helix transcriptional regulator n=1 Tax=Methylosinus sp. LW4 TaxID=136993 RepID=UPI0003784892|nr:hypothetical protein [Methylosinus sp. LW4]
MNQFDGTILLNKSEIAATLGVSPFLVRKLVTLPDFPPPIVLHLRPLWRLDDVRAWKQKRFNANEAA